MDATDSGQDMAERFWTLCQGTKLFNWFVNISACLSGLHQCTKFRSFAFKLVRFLSVYSFFFFFLERDISEFVVLNVWTIEGFCFCLLFLKLSGTLSLPG